MVAGLELLGIGAFSQLLQPNNKYEVMLVFRLLERLNYVPTSVIHMSLTEMGDILDLHETKISKIVKKLKVNRIIKKVTSPDQKSCYQFILD